MHLFKSSVVAIFSRCAKKNPLQPKWLKLRHIHFRYYDGVGESKKKLDLHSYEWCERHNILLHYIHTTYIPKWITRFAELPTNAAKLIVRSRRCRQAGNCKWNGATILWIYIRTIYTFRWFCELWMEWQCSEWCGSTNLTDSMMHCTFWAGNRLNRSGNGHNSFTTFILYSYISCVTTWTFSLSPNYFLLIRRHNRHISMEL